MLGLRISGLILLGLVILSLLVSRWGKRWDLASSWERALILPGVWGWAAVLLLLLLIVLIRFAEGLDFPDDFGGSDSTGKDKKR